MEEYIGKVKLNYDFYSGDDSYSDGSIEDTLLDIVKNTESDMLEKRIAEEEDWAVLYHLSDIRKNILEWYDMKPGANVLEIGAGCGAVTGVLCDKAEEVVCIDLSKKRSHINAYRNQQYDNLTIYVGNFKVKDSGSSGGHNGLNNIIQQLGTTNCNTHWGAGVFDLLCGRR